MTTAWKVRHEGSPKAIEDLSLPQVLEGMQDGLWEPTDEVMGPSDAGWVAIENHPQLAEAAADMEPPPARTYDDETRLDMTPLIDVTLVLLIFFILTTTYAVLQKVHETPDVSKEKVRDAVHMDKAKETMILVTVKLENGKPVTRVEDNPVAPDDLLNTLTQLVKNTSKSTLLLQADADVPHGAVVKVQDAAAGAKMTSIKLVVPQNEQGKK
jgi:biopolymer transport protein ExbD